jgi:hypothetical protein
MTLVSRSASSIRRSSLPGRENAVLPDEFIERPRPHPHRQRRDAVEILLAGSNSAKRSIEFQPHPQFVFYPHCHTFQA